MNSGKKTLKEVFRRPYLFWLTGIFLVYITLNVYLSQFYITLIYMWHYLDTINWAEFFLSIFFTIAIASLISVNSVYAYIKFKERRDKQNI